MARVGAILGKPGYVNLVLTEREAKALMQAAASTLDHPDSALAFQERGRDLAAANRALLALERGWARVSRGEE